MAEEQTNQPSRADEYRKAADYYSETESGIQTTNGKIEVGLRSATMAMWAIAAELAEANSRDREAEIRMKGAEAFVAGMQAELARQHIVVPGGVPQIKPPRGK
jgi:repressor of nif and glnA expression